MPTAKYNVYVSNAARVTAIEEYCEANDLSESEFFKRAADELLTEDA